MSHHNWINKSIYLDCQVYYDFSPNDLKKKKFVKLASISISFYVDICELIWKLLLKDNVEKDHSGISEYTSQGINRDK